MTIILVWWTLGYAPTNFRPTRAAVKSCSTIEQIWTHYNQKLLLSAIICSALSDHSPIFVCKRFYVESPENNYVRCKLRRINANVERSLGSSSHFIPDWTTILIILLNIFMMAYQIRLAKRTVMFHHLKKWKRIVRYF